jgi:hypothetical protein
MSTERDQVVVIGGGFGGLNVAKALANADVDVTLVDRPTTIVSAAALSGRYRNSSGRPHRARAPQPHQGPDKRAGVAWRGPRHLPRRTQRVGSRAGREAARHGLRHLVVATGPCPNIRRCPYSGKMASLKQAPRRRTPAVQEGKYVGKLIHYRLAGTPSRIGPFRYRDKGSMATIGRSKAVADSLGARFTALPAYRIGVRPRPVPHRRGQPPRHPVRLASLPDSQEQPPLPRHQSAERPARADPRYSSRPRERRRRQIQLANR